MDQLELDMIGKNSPMWQDKASQKIGGGPFRKAANFARQIHSGMTVGCPIVRLGFVVRVLSSVCCREGIAVRDYPRAFVAGVGDGSKLSQDEAGGLLATIGIDGGCLRYQAYTGHILLKTRVSAHSPR
ncbi:uncharacterized protein BO96DRAFT_435831 [Aspergillus niger CBS 101883]|uniref:Uncharacterized protein n=2 Tax=Aspergillus niger TaxID=5061 RepID=A5AB11_ASPNC|nr:uncharacterized protein BO96DRAFT_435831 [Aspergillus niger CBS 101883]XP_059606164.1 hypothetical protein An08g08650 [Aspergillus niger]PYH54637.1 hypothetical protein BO96DRAFT_435831 [Aspergillus niger CBS 101883]CAK96645.1 hypothetical protein An08g08650 [Aspergillus niger]